MQHIKLLMSAFRRHLLNFQPERSLQGALLYTKLVQTSSLPDVCCPECRLQALRAYLSGDSVKAEAAAAAQASRKADHEELAANVSFLSLIMALSEPHGITLKGHRSLSGMPSMLCHLCLQTCQVP